MSLNRRDFVASVGLSFVGAAASTVCPSEHAIGPVLPAVSIARTQE